MSSRYNYKNSNHFSSATDDPVFRKVSWTPAKKGGADYKSHRLVISGHTIAMDVSLGSKVFGYLIVVAGLTTIVTLGVPFLYIGQFFIGMSATGFGSIVVWSVISGARKKRNRLLTFDKLTGRYYDAKHKNHHIRPSSRDEGGKLSDIYAIQLVEEDIRRVNSVGYTSYEMNLVFPDGVRVTLMDHRYHADIRKAAVTLGAFLDVPVWDREIKTATEKKRVSANKTVATVRDRGNHAEISESDSMPLVSLNIPVWGQGLQNEREKKQWSATKRLAYTLLVIVLLSLAGMFVVGPEFINEVVGGEHDPYGAEWAALRGERRINSPEVISVLKGMPKGILNPDFCVFDEVVSGRNGIDQSIWGMTDIPIMEAGSKIHAYMRNTEWEPDGVIKQHDAAVLYYRKGNIRVDYTFLRKSGKLNRCLLSWKIKS